jgi:uncharacterized membrane protein YuzA (DUF378 family)
MRRNTTLDRVSWVLTSIGALNWGMKALFDLDLVAAVFGRDTFLSRFVYGLVGLAGVWSISHLASALTRAPTPIEALRRAA